MMKTITKRQIILHERNWYWTNGRIRQYVREVSDTQLDRFPPNGILYPMTVDDLRNLMNETDHGPMDNVAVFSADDYLVLYQGVFLRDDNLLKQLTLPQTPLTLKMDRYCLTYEGVMGVFKLADMLLRHPKYYLRDDNARSGTAWLRRVRLVAAKSIRKYHLELTRLAVDGAIIQGTRLDQHVGQVFALGYFVGNDVLTAANSVYPGDLECEIVKVRVSPLDFTLVALDDIVDSPYLSTPGYYVPKQPQHDTKVL